MTDSATTQPRKRGRPPMVGRRDEILDAAVAVMAERGVESLSMNQLAEALGFSPYALTYHFGTREDVLVAVAEHVEARLQADFTRLAGEDGKADYGAILRRYWATVQQAPTSAAATRLWLEFVVLASRQPERFPNFVDRAVFAWRDAIRAGLGDRPDVDAMSTLVLASVIGMELLHTARPGALDMAAALEAFIGLVADQRSLGGLPLP